MTQTKFQTAHASHIRVRKSFPDETMAKQSFKDECDINGIMARFEKHGIIEHVNKFQGDYGDFTEVQDYHTSMGQIIAAQEAFDSLPAKIRSRFGNQPAAFIEFVDDEDNEEEMRELGLLPALSVPAEPEKAPGGGTPPEKAKAAAEPKARGPEGPQAQSEGE